MFKSIDLFRKSNLTHESAPAHKLKQALVFNTKERDYFTLKSTISSFNLQPVFLSNPSVLYEHFRQSSPVFIIADTDDNPEFGVSIFRAIRGTKLTKNTPVLFICKMTNVLERKLRSVGNNFSIITRPVLPSPLYNRIELMTPKRNWSALFNQQETIKPEIKNARESFPPVKQTQDNQNSKKELDEGGFITRNKAEPDLRHLSNNESIQSRSYDPEKSPNRTKINTEKIIEKTDNKTSPSIKKSESGNFPVKNIYNEISGRIERLLESIDQNLPVSLTPIKEIAPDLIKEIPINKDLEIRAINRRKPLDLHYRMLNMTIFGLLIAHQMKLTGSEMRKLATVGLTHDLGMRKVSKSILMKEKPLTDAEYGQIMRHLDDTADIIRSAEDFDPAADEEIIRISYQIHEREDGSGYPNKLRSKEIDRIAKILAVADRFEAMSHPRNYRKAFLAINALQKMIRLKEKEFAPEIIKALVSALSVFPIDSYVQLSDKRIGRVRSLNGKHPLRPVLDILVDEKNEIVKPPAEFDLTDAPFVYISKTLTLEEINEIDSRLS